VADEGLRVGRETTLDLRPGKLPKRDLQGGLCYEAPAGGVLILPFESQRNVEAGEKKSMRYAIYFTPDRNHRLTEAAARWLGRDPFGGDAGPDAGEPDLSRAEIDAKTASARRYGFHATLKPPFGLADGMTGERLDRALAAHAAALEPVALDLVLGQIDGFFALVPKARNPALHALADGVVRAFEPFRAPLSPEDIARRNPEALSPAGRQNLERWGYPYVFDEFQFHMTLTDRVFGEDARRVKAALDRRFGPILSDPVLLDALALFLEPEPGAPFMVQALHALGAGKERKSA